MKHFILLILAGLVIGACEKESVGLRQIKLDHYTEQFDISDLDFQPQAQINFEYDKFGTLTKSTFLSYNPDTKLMGEQRHMIFYFKNNQVDKIEGFMANNSTPYVTYTYSYLQDSRVDKIAENNSSTGLTSEVNFSYLANDSIEARYQYSNGGSFEYRFRYLNGNILNDKTTRGLQLCSDGVYTYDQFKNPLQTLGYIDYDLINFSVNNKVTENVEYVGCAFPSLLPESYVYEYDSNGYPTTATTFYKGGTIRKSERKYYYSVH